MKTIYTAVATVHGGREGHVTSDDGVLDLDLRIPKSMGGPGGAGSSLPPATPRASRAPSAW
jgi:osmotically inducible protein OsmC